MLDAWIIDEIKRREREEQSRRRAPQPQIERPHEPRLPAPGPEQEKPERGAVIVDYTV